VGAVILLKKLFSPDSSLVLVLVLVLTLTSIQFDLVKTHESELELKPASRLYQEMNELKHKSIGFVRSAHPGELLFSIIPERLVPSWFLLGDAVSTHFPRTHPSQPTPLSSTPFYVHECNCNLQQSA